MPANLENLAAATGLEKVNFHSNPKERQSPRCSNYHTIALISHASKIMFKILQARLQQYMNPKLPDILAVFRKGRGTRHQNANIHWITEKAREFQKTIYFCFIDHANPFSCGSQQTGKCFKRWEYQTSWPGSWEICMQVKKQQLESDMEWAGSKLGKEYLKSV